MEEVEEDVSSQDESKSKDEKMGVASEEEPKNGVESSNGHESNTAQGNIENGHTDMFKCFAFCKGFTDEDCDVEEYFEENHENVEQVIFCMGPPLWWSRNHEARSVQSVPCELPPGAISKFPLTVA